jgi:hypothetical protein
MMSRGVGVFGRAAEAESRRRLLITAIALERHKLRAGSYPKTLTELNASPTELNDAKSLIDFMDGKPLRYRLTQDDQFVLYSVGLDCADNGGIAAADAQRFPTPGQPARGWGFQIGRDLVWPRAASQQEVKAQEQRELEEDKRRPTFQPLRRPRRPTVTE